MIQQTFEEERNSQLLAGQSQTLKHQNGVELDSESICKHHGSLRPKKLLCLPFTRLNLVIMAHWAPPCEQLFCVTYSIQDSPFRPKAHRRPCKL